MDEKRVREEVEKVLEFERHCVEVDSAMAHAFIVPEDDEQKMTVVAFGNDVMGDWKAKNNAAAFILINMFEQNGIGIFVSEAWVASIPANMDPGKARRKMPKNLGDLPKDQRSEVLMCCLNQIGKQRRYIVQQFERDQRGKPVWGKVEWDTLNKAGGRFLFDFAECRCGKGNGKSVDVWAGRLLHGKLKGENDGDDFEQKEICTEDGDGSVESRIAGTGKNNLAV